MRVTGRGLSQGLRGFSGGEGFGREGILWRRRCGWEGLARGKWCVSSWDGTRFPKEGKGLGVGVGW